MPQEDALRVQHALRRTGGAGGVEQHGGVVGQGGAGLIPAGPAFELLPEVARTLDFAIHREHRLEVGQPVESGGDAREVLPIGHEHLRCPVREPELQVFEPELREERYRDRPALEARQVRERGLHRLAEQDRYPISALHAVGFEEVRATVGELLDLMKGPLARPPGRAFDHERDAPGLRGMTVAGVVRHVVAFRDVPAEPVVHVR